MKKRHGHADDGCMAVICGIIFAGIVGGVYGYSTGWDAGVRDAVAGRATVIEKPDGTTEAVKVKAKEAQ